MWGHRSRRVVNWRKYTELRLMPPGPRRKTSLGKGAWRIENACISEIVCGRSGIAVLARRPAPTDDSPTATSPRRYSAPQTATWGRIRRGAEIPRSCGSSHRASWYICVNFDGFPGLPNKEAIETQLPRLLVHPSTIIGGCWWNTMTVYRTPRAARATSPSNGWSAPTCSAIPDSAR